MSKITLAPNASGTGTLTVAAPNTSTDYTLTLPTATTTLVGTDATQTLTNKSIAGSQLTGTVAGSLLTGSVASSLLTGALPAIDGSALTGIVTGGMTLLGTIATTSGTSVTLSGLTLTSYKQLSIIINGVSSATVANAYLLLNSIQIARLYATAFTDSALGIATIDLGTGIFVSNTVYVYAGANYASSTFGGPSGLTTASTSVTFTITAGGATFDAGSIVIYGVK